MHHTPLLLKYLNAYQERPTSRVFAPLAEAYRKLGMVKDALKILKKGMSIHPNYILGHITLATCYCDLGKLALAKQTIEGFIEDHLDNILLQSLYASICEQLGEHDKALATYKYLLFLNPKKEEWIEKVTSLESQLICEQDVIADEKVFPLRVGGTLYDYSINNTQTPTEEQKSADWQAVNWLSEHIDQVEERREEWTMELPTQTQIQIQTPLQPQPQIQIAEAPPIEIAIDAQIEIKPPKVESIVSYTLVDLYVRQGHLDKALQVLEKIRKMVPDDPVALERWEELKKKMNAVRYENFYQAFRTQTDHFLQQIHIARGKENDFFSQMA